MNGASHIQYLTNRGNATLNDTSSAYSASNRGALTLRDASRIGAGVPDAVFNAGILTLDDASGIGGVHNGPGAAIVMNGQSFISGVFGSGVFNAGTLTLNGSASISDNHGEYPHCGIGCQPRPIGGGGVFNSGTLVLNDSSAITDNSVPDYQLGSYGGGVYMIRDPSLPGPPSLTMTGSSTITGNSAGDRGGGIYAASGGILNGVVCGPGGNVYGNTPDDCHFEP